jgi:hypothetical protein
MRNFKAEHRVYSVLLSLSFLGALLLFPRPLALAEPGFWAVDSIDIPGVIKEKSESVYQMIVLASSPHETLKKVAYEGSLSKERERLVADMKKPPTEMPSGDLGSYYQIESCINSSWGQCEIYRTLALGTAFEAGLDPSASSLWTSYGNVKEVIKNHLEKQGLSDSDKEKRIEEAGIPLNIVLVKKDKKVVFDTRIQGRSAKILDFARGIGVVRIELSEAIGKPLLFGEHKGGAGRGVEDIYIMGFPVVQRDETGREDFYAYPLRRYDLSVTIGEVFLKPAHSGHTSDARHIECDADSAPGMSGGPAFDERGEVIGIFVKPIAFKVGSVLAPTNQIYTHFRD